MTDLDGIKSRILVIDDDAITRKMIEKTLLKSGYDVESRAGGKDGLVCAVEFKPEIILLDVIMPVMDGYQTCQELRKVFDHNETKIIMLTGLNDGSSVDKAFDMGANDFITKPINWSLLVKRVRYALRERHMYYQLAENEARLKQSQRMAGISYWEYNPETDNVEISGVFCDAALGGQNSINKDKFFDLIYHEDRKMIVDEFCRICLDGGSYHKDHRLIDSDGNEVIYQQLAEAIAGSDGHLVSVLGTLQDITKERHASALIEYQKYYDELTGAPNKQFFYKELEAVIEKGDTCELTAIVFIGIDRFKTINNSLGYKVGDEILKSSVDRIKFAAGPHSIVSRYSGDSFAVIIKGLHHLDELELQLELLQKLISDPYLINNEKLFLSCSSGIVIYPLEDGDSAYLTACAESAMNQAKSLGGNQYCYHSQELSEKAIRMRKLEKQIRNAIDNNGFHMLYQPQIGLKSGSCIGAEALIRMVDDDGKVVSPVEFIPVAEDTGLIVEIGYWIIDTVCKQISDWETSGMNGMRIGINLSARQFIDPKLVSAINNAVKKYNVPKQCIDLEITESIAMDDLGKTLEILHEFKKSGYTISMDDFGTGHSSLSYLQKMPIDVLKVDRAFIKDIASNGENGAIAKTIIAMGHALNMTVIAEGAETEEHMTFLYKEDCDEVQGFFYSPPVNVEAFNDFYDSMTARSPGARTGAC